MVPKLNLHSFNNYYNNLMNRSSFSVVTFPYWASSLYVLSNSPFPWRHSPNETFHHKHNIMTTIYQWKLQRSFDLCKRNESFLLHFWISVSLNPGDCCQQIWSKTTPTLLNYQLPKAQIWMTQANIKQIQRNYSNTVITLCTDICEHYRQQPHKHK